MYTQTFNLPTFSMEWESLDDLMYTYGAGPYCIIIIVAIQEQEADHRILGPQKKN